LFTQKKFCLLDDAQKNCVGVSCSMTTIGSLFIELINLFFALLDFGTTIIEGFISFYHCGSLLTASEE